MFEFVNVVVVQAFLPSGGRYLSCADQHSAVANSSWEKLVQAFECSSQSVPRAGLQRFQASAGHEPHIDQHQREGARPSSPRSARPVHKLALQQPFSAVLSAPAAGRDRILSLIMNPCANSALYTVRIHHID